MNTDILLANEVVHITYTTD